jgi:hypothetical protein
MIFMHDVLATGTKVQVFTLIDVWRHECLARGTPIHGHRCGGHFGGRRTDARRIPGGDSA